MFSRANLVRGLGLTVVVALGYFIPNNFILFPTHSVLLTPVDHWVQLSPVWTWFYISYYPLLISAYFLTTDHPAQKVYVGAMSLAAVVGFFIFLFFPTEIPRGLYPWHGGQDLSAALLEHIRKADRSVNCLPSMHVGMSFIAASVITMSTPSRGRHIVWALFFAIVYSTMATKQHYFVDLVAGFALGLTVTAIFAKKHGTTFITPNSTSSSTDYE